jgi:hypothetical protein
VSRKESHALRKSGEQDAAAEWQELMQLWDSVCAKCSRIRAARSHPPDIRKDDQKSETALEEARRSLIAIKQQIDGLVSGGAHSRAASSDSLRLALIKLKATLLIDATSSADSASSDQAAATEAGASASRIKPA